MPLFGKKGKLSGTVEVTNVPPFIGSSTSMTFFRVEGADAAPPFSDCAPPEARNDEEELGEKMHFEKENTGGSLTVKFELLRPVGWCYMQLNIILYQCQEGKTFAQVESFPFTKRPLEITPEGQTITLPAKWPETPLSELGHYGTITPKEQ